MFHTIAKHREIDSDMGTIKSLDKRDDFNFACVNLLFICSNIPSAFTYGVYIYQLTRYSRAFDDDSLYTPYNRHLSIGCYNSWYVIYCK